MTTRRPDFTLCCCLSSSRNKIFHFPDLKEILPSGYKYEVCNWNKEEAGYFETRFRLNIHTTAQIHIWLREFCIATNTVFKSEKKLPKCEEAEIFALRCEHSTKEPPKKYENVEFLLIKEILCPTRLVIILKLPKFAEKYENEDVHFDDFSTTVIYHQHHNHHVKPLVDFRYNPRVTEEYLISDTFTAENEELVENNSAATEGNKSENLRGENISVKCSYPETPSYLEVLDCVFPAKSTERQNQSGFLLPPESRPFFLSIDSDSMVDYFRSKSRHKRPIEIPDQSYRRIGRFRPFRQLTMENSIPLHQLPGICLKRILEEVNLLENEDQNKE